MCIKPHGALAPWRIVLRNHQRVEGMAVPMEVGLSWELPEGRFETLRVRVEDVRYMR